MNKSDGELMSDLIAICKSQIEEIDRLNVIIKKQADHIERLMIDNAFATGKVRP